MIHRRRAPSVLIFLLATSQVAAAVVGQIGSSAGTAAGTQYQTTAGSVVVVQEATTGAVYRTGALSVFDGSVIPGDNIFSDSFEAGGSP
jgi:hypothetical protein